MKSLTRNPEKHKEALLKALEHSLGIVSSACKAVNVSRNLYYIYYNTDLDFRAAVDDIQNIAFDFVETQLFRKIKDGDTNAILFYIKHKGGKRGYSNTTDLHLTGTIEDIKVIKLIGPQIENNKEDGVE